MFFCKPSTGPLERSLSYVAATSEEKVAVTRAERTRPIDRRGNPRVLRAISACSINLHGCDSARSVVVDGVSRTYRFLIGRFPRFFKKLKFECRANNAVTPWWKDSRVPRFSAPLPNIIDEWHQGTPAIRRFDEPRDQVFKLSLISREPSGTHRRPLYIPVL